MRGRGRAGYSVASASPAKPKTGSGGMYDSLVRTGIEKRLNQNEADLETLKQQLAALEALKKTSQADGSTENSSGSAVPAPESTAPTTEFKVEHEIAGFTEALMDEIFADMFEEIKGYRPTKGEIAVFKATQMDDYDNELEEFEQEACEDDMEQEDCYVEDEYSYEEVERQRLLQEMLNEEEGVDVCTDGAVFFDVAAQMKELQIQRDEAAAAAGTTSRVIITDPAPKVTPPTSTFKLNAAAKEWKPFSTE